MLQYHALSRNGYCKHTTGMILGTISACQLRRLTANKRCICIAFSSIAAATGKSSNDYSLHQIADLVCELLSK